MVSLLLLLIQTRTLQQIGKNVFIKMNEKKKKIFHHHHHHPNMYKLEITRTKL